MVTQRDGKGRKQPKKVKNQQSARKPTSTHNGLLKTSLTIVVVAIVSILIVVFVIAPPGILDDPSDNNTTTTTISTTVSGTSSTITTNTATSISWEYNLTDGLALAAAENKIVMVDFYADWCFWCKQLDENVYTNPSVILASQNFINVKHDVVADSSVEDEYGVYWLPMILFMDADKNVVTRVDGYVPANEFLGHMNQALQEFQG